MRGRPFSGRPFSGRPFSGRRRLHGGAAIPAAGEVYASLLKEFVNLYEKTKAIHKRLNGRRLIG